MLDPARGQRDLRRILHAHRISRLVRNDGLKNTITFRESTGYGWSDYGEKSVD